MEWEPKPDSPAARIDEEEHKRFIARCAEELAANEPPKQAPKYVTEAELQRALDGVCETIGRGVAKMVLKPLEARIEAVEAKALTLGGVWREGQYAERTLVQKDGGLWLSMAPTSAKPGNGSGAWKLVVKRGAAG
jgi:hypothetical protein